MRRLLSYTVAVTALATAAVAAQKVTTPEGLDAAMKKIAPAQAATNKAMMPTWATRRMTPRWRRGAGVSESAIG